MSFTEFSEALGLTPEQHVNLTEMFKGYDAKEAKV